MRRASNVDVNHAEIVQKLRGAGCAVEPRLAQVGHGVPDLLVGFRGHNILLEVKRPEFECRKKLTVDEQDWHDKWAGQVAIVTSFDEAMEAVLKVAL